MVLVDCWEDDHKGAPRPRLLLDRIPIITGQRGGIPAHAHCFYKACRRLTFANIKCLHIQTIHPTLFNESNPQIQASDCHQGEEFRVYLNLFPLKPKISTKFDENSMFWRAVVYGNSYYLTVSAWEGIDKLARFNFCCCPFKNEQSFFDVISFVT